jgi:hypothetical protein
MKQSIIYINGDFMRLCQAGIEKNIPNILKEEKIGISSLKKDTIAAYIAEFFTGNKITPENLILGIPRAQVSVKYLTLPASENAEIGKMVEYELNNLFPFKPEELIIDYAVINKEPKGFSELILFAAPRETILNHISTLEHAGISPDAVSISTISLFNQLCHKNKLQTNCLVVYFDDPFMEIIFINNNRLALSRGISIKQNAANTELIKEIKLTADVLKDKGENIDKIILGGDMPTRHSERSQQGRLPAGRQEVKNLENEQILRPAYGLPQDDTNRNNPDLESFARDLEEALKIKVKINSALGVVNGFVADIDSAALNINLLPEDFKIKKNRSRKKKLFLHLCALLLLNLSLAVNISYLNLKVKKEYLNQLKTELRKVSAPAFELQKKKLRALMLKNYRNSNILVLKLLSEIYRVAPEKINLSLLDIGIRDASGIIVVSGQAKDSETALNFSRAIQNSKLFMKADVKYIKKISSASQNELVDFEINAIF